MHEQKQLQIISLENSGRNSSTDCCMEKVKTANQKLTEEHEQELELREEMIN